MEQHQLLNSRASNHSFLELLYGGDYYPDALVDRAYNYPADVEELITPREW